MYQIPAIANIDHFEFKSNITFFVGENGSGKSTLLEAFAVACGLNPEGGTANYRFSTYDDYSDLASAIRIRKGVCKPKWSYFLRAESFYNVASALMTKYNDDGKMQDLAVRSERSKLLSGQLSNAICFTMRLLPVPEIPASNKNGLVRIARRYIK